MKPHEDWVSESWTVDCVCGVNFDDGKEMVDCDECGVWVHTWCSRYVKGDDLFVCHKCKIINNNDDIELSKLPPVTKSIRMGNVSTQTQSETVPILKPCSEIPIEERVHVQGVPGGDLALFECVSSVFSRQLWTCSGYVPKKFSFQYREFPCWDEKEDDGKGKDARNWGCRDIEIKHSHQSDVDKEKSLLLRLSTNKRRKDLPGAFEDQANKKAKEEDGDKKTVVL